MNFKDLKKNKRGQQNKTLENPLRQTVAPNFFNPNDGDLQRELQAKRDRAMSYRKRDQFQQHPQFNNSMGPANFNPNFQPIQPSPPQIQRPKMDPLMNTPKNLRRKSSKQSLDLRDLKNILGEVEPEPPANRPLPTSYLKRNPKFKGKFPL
jgi:hypothetical protein